MWSRVFYIPWCEFLNMWLIGHLLGHKVVIFEMSKSWQFFWPPQISEFWAINWHRCVTICKLKCHFSVFLGGGIWCPSYGCSSNSAKYKSFHLQHKGSIIWMECYLVICRGPFYLPKDSFWEFLWFAVFSQTEKIWNFFQWATACLLVGSGGQKWYERSI